MNEFATVFVGLLAGSLLTEGLVLVPLWRQLTSDQFYKLHPLAGPKLFRYFAPITVLGVIAALLNALLNPELKALAAALLCLMALATFFIFFKKANAVLSAHEYSSDQLPIVLKKWAVWHHSRTIMVLIAFVILTF